MPACLTHNCFAKDVLERLALPEVDRTAYLWGAQGPDFLFCHRYLQSAAKKDVKSLKEYGSALHKTAPSITLSAMRGFLSNRGDISYRSYVLGFLCHYALDSTAHPYINARAQDMCAGRPEENESTAHGEIEASLDAIVLRWKTGQLPSQVKLSDMFPKNEGVQRKIACLYRDVLFGVYGTDVSEEELYRSTKDARFIFSATTDRTGLKRAFFQSLEKGRPHYVTSHLVPLTEDPDMDYANTRREEWIWKNFASRQDFFELYEEALEKAARFAREFDTADLKALTGDRPFG